MIERHLILHSFSILTFYVVNQILQIFPTASKKQCTLFGNRGSISIFKNYVKKVQKPILLSPVSVADLDMNKGVMKVRSEDKLNTVYKVYEGMEQC